MSTALFFVCTLVNFWCAHTYTCVCFTCAKKGEKVIICFVSHLQCGICFKMLVAMPLCFDLLTYSGRVNKIANYNGLIIIL